MHILHLKWQKSPLDCFYGRFCHFSSLNCFYGRFCHFSSLDCFYGRSCHFSSLDCFYGRFCHFSSLNFIFIVAIFNQWEIPLEFSNIWLYKHPCLNNHPTFWQVRPPYLHTLRHPTMMHITQYKIIYFQMVQPKEAKPTIPNICLGPT